MIIAKRTGFYSNVINLILVNNKLNNQNKYVTNIKKLCR